VDVEFIKQMAMDMNNLVIATAKPYQEQISRTTSQFQRIISLAKQGQQICTCPARHLFDEIMETAGTLNENLPR
jgi:hypothetical protein